MEIEFVSSNNCSIDGDRDDYNEKKMRRRWAAVSDLSSHIDLEPVPLLPLSFILSIIMIVKI